MTFYTVDCRCGQISFHLPIFPDGSALEGLLWNDKDQIRDKGGNVISTQVKSRIWLLIWKEVLLLLKYSVSGEEVKLFMVSAFLVGILQPLSDSGSFSPLVQFIQAGLNTTIKLLKVWTNHTELFSWKWYKSGHKEVLEQFLVGTWSTLQWDTSTKYTLHVWANI